MQRLIPYHGEEKLLLIIIFIIIIIVIIIFVVAVRKQCGEKSFSLANLEEF